MLVVKKTFIQSKVRMLETNQSQKMKKNYLDLISIDITYYILSSANEKSIEY
jgi:hypothetical protein